MLGYGRQPAGPPDGSFMFTLPIVCVTVCHQKDPEGTNLVGRGRSAAKCKCNCATLSKTTLEDDMGLCENRASPFPSMVCHHFLCSHNLVVCKNSAPRLEPFAGGDWNPDDRGWWIQWIQWIQWILLLKTNILSTIWL